LMVRFIRSTCPLSGMMFAVPYASICFLRKAVLW
jgi:hypothetical protein